jgi:hypothetical protein
VLVEWCELRAAELGVRSKVEGGSNIARTSVTVLPTAAIEPVTCKTAYQTTASGAAFFLKIFFDKTNLEILVQTVTVVA